MPPGQKQMHINSSSGGPGQVRNPSSTLMNKIQGEDPDVLVAHNLFGFDFDVLLTRAIENKLNTWSKLGR